MPVSARTAADIANRMDEKPCSCNRNLPGVEYALESVGKSAGGLNSLLTSSHHQKNLFLGTDRDRMRTHRVRSLGPVLPDLPCLLCLTFLTSGAPALPTFPPQRPTRLFPPHPLLVAPPCIRPLILSSTSLLPTPYRSARPVTISSTLTPLATYICPLASASVHCHPTSLFS